MGSLRLVTILLLLGSPAFAQSSPTYGVGRTPTAEEIRALDISIAPTGEELPPGRGTAKEGAEVFKEKGCLRPGIRSFLGVETLTRSADNDCGCTGQHQIHA